MAQNGLPTLHVDPNLLARELDTSLSLANRSPTGPDDEALLRDASKRLGIPLDTARTNPQGTKQALQDSSVDFNDYARRFPSSAQYLANPDNALISRDDVAPLSEVEQTLRAAIRQSMLADVGVGVNTGQAIVEKFSPGYSAEVAREREVLRTEGFAAAAKLRRENQARREAELARNTGRIGEIQQPEPTIGNMALGLASGTASAFESQRLGLAQQLGDLFTDPESPEGEARTARYNRARAQQDFRASLDRPEFDTWLADATYGGFESLAQTAPALALSIGTGTAVPGLVAMGAQSYGEAYGRYRGRGAERGAASLGAGGEAAVEVLTEVLPMKFMVDRFGKTGMTDFLKGFLGREVPGEQVATLVQDAIDTAIANPDKTWGEYWAERPEAAARTLVATLVQSGTVAAVGEGAGRLAGTIDRRQDEIDEARAGAAQLEQILAAAARSVTRQRNPASFSQLVQQAAEDGGTAPTELFIDARTLVEALEQSGMSREQLEQSLPSVAEQLEVALALEADLVVPIGEATTALAGTELEQLLAQNARTREDGLSQAEAEAMDAEMLQQLEGEAAKVFAEQSDKVAWENDAKQVFDTLTAELGNAGRFTPDVNRAYATLLRNFYATTASRLGTTPSELYGRFPLRVSSRAPGQQSQVLDQSVLQQFGVLEADMALPLVALASRNVDAPVSSLTPAESTNLPLGSIRVETFGEQRNRYVDVLREVPVGALLLAEPEEGIRATPEYQQYVEWAREGREAPAIQVNENERGELVASNRRRALAAKEAGLETIKAWVSPLNPQTGDPLKYGDLQAQQTEPSVLNQETQGERNLFVAHNLSAENILAASGLGGLAAPSIAVGRTDIGFDDFGEVTLLADPQMLQDKKIRTFDADVYSPRQPRAHYDIDTAAFRAFTDTLDPDNLGLSQPDLSELAGTDGAEALLRSDAVRLKFLQEQGKAPRLKNAKADPLVKRAAKLDADRYSLQSDPKVVALAVKYYEGLVQKAEAGGRGERYRSMWFNEDGTLQSNSLRSFADLVRRFKDSDGKDVDQLRHDLRAKFHNQKLSDEYQQWAADHFNAMVKGRRLFKGFTDAGNRRYIPYTMENVVKEMTQQLQAGEGTFYGAGSARSAYANEMRTLDQIRARRGQIVSKEEFEKVREESNAVFQEALDKLKPFYKFDADSWNYADDAGAAIAEGARGLREAFESDPEVQRIVGELTEYLRNLPTQYFEAKAQRAVQFSEFDTAVVPKGMRKDALQILREAGLKIKTYDRGVDGSRDGVVAQQQRLLFQNQGSSARPSFNPAALEISLLEKADLSSFLHEAGHFFFEMTATLAAEPGAPQELVDDMQLLLDNVGYEGTLEDWVTLSVNERREAHETIAESFEQYLFTGKAPTTAMQPLFRRFKSWMVSVYRSLQEFLAGNERASLSPEVSGVFDRLIATEEEIRAAQAVRDFQPLFETAEAAGMTPEEWAGYESNIEQHQAEALEELQTRSLRDMKWLDNARGRKLRELQRDAAARRKAMRDEITAEIEAEPVYAAMEFLKHGRLQADNEEIQIAENKAHKLNIDAVAALFPEGELGDSTSWKKLGYGKYGMLSNEGLPPDVVAEMFGFKSGRDLVTSILNAEPKAQAINGLTDQRMLERYGDLSSPAAMREAANEALANEARARMVATELKAVASLTGSPSALARAARQAAEEIVAARKVRNLRPDLAAAAAQRARKAAEKAMAAGDTAGAAAAKRTEMLNVQLERAERNARAEHDKALRGFQKINKGTNERLAKSRDVDLVNAARAVLARYGLAPRGAAINAQNYMEMLQTYDGSLAEDLRSMLQGLPPTMDFRDMTVEQFNGMRDIVNGLYYLSKRTKQMEIDGEKVELDAVADEIVAGVLERTGGELPPLPGYTNTTTRADEWKVGLLGAKASLMRVEAWADAMGAPFKKYIWQPVSEAITRTKVKRNEMVKQYLDLLKAIEKGLTYDKINAPELGSAGFTFNAGKTELLHAVLHTGNQSNLKKLLLGRGWGTLREDGSLDTSRWDAFMQRMFAEGTITQADMDFTQGVWDLLETIKVDAQAAHKEMYGYYFSEITADPVQTPWGEYRGGYVPAIADTLSSPDAAQKREQEELLHAGNSFMFPTTGKGFTQSRVEYNRPLALDLRSIGMHLDKVARFAYIEPAVRDVGKLLMNRRVARAMNGYDQGLISSMLNPWLQRSARQNVNSPGKNPKVDKFFNELRTRSGMVLMFGNIVNTMQQITGFSLAALKVPAHRLLRANARYVTNHFEVVENARTLSPWLADRMDNHSFEMMGQIDKILLDPNPIKRSAEYLRRNAYFMQQGIQNVMDIIVWTGAYDHAVAKGSSQKDAVRYADETVRMTQGSFAPEDVSAFEVQSPFVRLFTQFYGYFNMWGNLLGAEGSKALRDAGFVKASPRLLFLWFVGMAIPAFVAELIAAGAPDEEDDEDGDGLLDEWLAMFFGAQAKSVAAMVPVAGQVSVLASNYMDDKVYNDRLNISPAVSLLESAVYGGTSLVSGELFDEDPTKKELRSALILTGMALGIPVGPLMRAGGFAIDEAEGRKEADNALEYGTGLLLGR